ncbi:acyl-CoA-binding protein [Flammeovirgaceae bacterium SG7u.111]|nr:acyl-CoA-binding protein [Flammeovirgaceae bacterium SG7u.132]WPO35420.1 acyl-CoA-binding protein [Flammeovirgaceae bacterium SG7u.111]
MGLDQNFEEAQKRVHQLDEKPSNEILLKLYGLFKQATEGDVKEERPGGFDFKAQFKWDAWNKLSGKSSDEAKQAYIALVDELAGH